MTEDGGESVARVENRTSEGKTEKGAGGGEKSREIQKRGGENRV